MEIERIDSFAGHRGAVFALAKGPAPHLFYSAGSDGWVVQWDLQKPDVGKVIAQLDGSVYAMAFDADSGILWVGQNHEGIHGILVSDQTRVFSLALDKVAIYAITIWNDQVWVGHQGGLVSVIDRHSHKIIKHIKAGSLSARAITIIDEQTISIGYSDGFIRMFDLRFDCVYTWLAHTNSVFSIAACADGRLISVGRDAHIRAWKWDGQQAEKVGEGIPGHIYTIHSIVLHPDQGLFATGSMDKTIKIWDAQTMQLRKVIDFARYGSHKHAINTLIWPTFNNLLVSASDDKMVSVWKID